MIRSGARREAIAAEAAAARKAMAAGDQGAAYRHLERAHILEQPWAGLHSWSHWAMLKLAVRDGDARMLLAFGGRGADGLTERADLAKVVVDERTFKACAMPPRTSAVF